MTQTLQPLWALRQAMLNCLEGGQFHVRERMTDTAVLPYEDFVQIGLALKACVLNPARHNELIDRLRPHVDVIIGVLPPGIQSQGLLSIPEEDAIAFKPLADWTMRSFGSGSLTWQLGVRRVDPSFEAVYMHADGEMRAMVLIDLLSKPHLISYEAAHLLPNH